MSKTSPTKKNKSAPNPIVGAGGRLSDLNWRCRQCTLSNKSSVHACTACGASKPPETACELTIAVTAPSAPPSASSPSASSSSSPTDQPDRMILIDNQKHTIKLGFFRDLLEAKLGIPDSKIIILFRDMIVEGDPNSYLLNCLPGCDPADVIPIVVHSWDTFTIVNDADDDTLPTSTTMTASKKNIRTESNSGTRNAISRQSSTDSQAGRMARAAAAKQAALANVDDDGAWGDADDGDAGDWSDDDVGDDDWPVDDEGVDMMGDAIEDTIRQAGKDAAAKLLAESLEEEEEEELKSPRTTMTPPAAASSSSSSLPSIPPLAVLTPTNFTTFSSNFDPLPSAQSGFTAKTSHYILRKPSQLEAHMSHTLDDLSDLLGLTSSEAGVLLRSYKDPWNRLKIEEAWMEDSETVRRESGLGPELDETKQIKETDLVECGTCGDDEVTAKESFALSCGHTYCDSCWTQWVTAEFDKGPSSIKTRCQGLKCSVILPHTRQISYLPNEKREKFVRWLLDDFVNWNSKSYRWCPHTDCTMNAERIEGIEHVGGVDCTCQHPWCFECGLEDHRPTSCEDAKRWTIKNTSDAENVTWILANTKVCPRCQVHIEKNQGCNHMTCRKCLHEFCWLCKGPWSGHTSCSLFNDIGNSSSSSSSKDASSSSSSSQEEASVKEAQTSLKKYMHYWSRFDNHSKSIRFAEKTLKKSEARMEEVQRQKGTNLLDVQFIIDSVRTVIANKRILQWLYAFSYYFSAPDGSSDRALFELQQSQLEQFTDELHGLTEQSIEILITHEMRVKMISFCSTVAKFRRGVMEAVEQINKKVEQQRQMEEKQTKLTSTRTPQSSTKNEVATKRKAASKVGKK